jgi:hypothetical protein
VIKWLNARSEKESRTPVYYEDVAQTLMYKTRQQIVTNGMVKWSANGSRAFSMIVISMPQPLSITVK